MDEGKTFIIVFAHGSKVPEANQAIALLAAEVSRKAGLPAIAAFLEIARPDLAAAVDQASALGARRAVVVPCFLTMGVHAREDLPRLVEQQQARFPRIEFLLAQSLEGHPGLAQALLERARDALAEQTSIPATSAKG